MSNSTTFPIPPEVQEIFDQADESGEFSAVIGPDSIKLASKDGKTIYKEVKWPQVSEWSAQFLRELQRVTTILTSEPVPPTT